MSYEEEDTYIQSMLPSTTACVYKTWQGCIVYTQTHTHTPIHSEHASFNDGTPRIYTKGGGDVTSAADGCAEVRVSRVGTLPQQASQAQILKKCSVWWLHVLNGVGR